MSTVNAVVMPRFRFAPPIPPLSSAMRRSPGRAVVWILTALCLMATGAGGLFNLASEWGDATTVAQYGVRAGQLVYGIGGVAAGVGLLADRSWTLTAARLWAIAVIVTGPLAVHAYAGSAATPGAIVAALLGSAAVAALLLWATHWSLVRKPGPTAAHDRPGR
jgi:hypothetical protein